VSFNEFATWAKREQLFLEPRAAPEKEPEPPARTSEREAPEAYVEKVLDRSGYSVLKAFRKYDRDRSSSISASEFRRLARDLGIHLSEEEARLQVKLIATRGGEEIQFGEFRAWFQKHDSLETLRWSERELESYRFFSGLFDAVDVDGSGLIEPAEFGQLHQRMRSEGFLIPEDAAECMAAMDEDRNGKISFNELMAYLKRLDAFAARRIGGTE